MGGVNTSSDKTEAVLFNNTFNKNKNIKDIRDMKDSGNKNKIIPNFYSDFMYVSTVSNSDNSVVNNTNGINSTHNIYNNTHKNSKSSKNINNKDEGKDTDIIDLKKKINMNMNLNTNLNKTMINQPNIIYTQYNHTHNDPYTNPLKNSNYSSFIQNKQTMTMWKKKQSNNNSNNTNNTNSTNNNTNNNTNNTNKDSDINEKDKINNTNEFVHNYGNFNIPHLSGTTFESEDNIESFYETPKKGSMANNYADLHIPQKDKDYHV